MRALFAVLFACLLVASLFNDASAGHHKKKRLLKKLVKGALVAKVLKPKVLPLPLPIPIPIGIHKSIGIENAFPWPVHEPVWAPAVHHDSYSYGGGYDAGYGGASYGGGY